MTEGIRRRFEQLAAKYPDAESQTLLIGCSEAVNEFCNAPPPTNDAELLQLGRDHASVLNILDMMSQSLRRLDRGTT